MCVKTALAIWSEQRRSEPGQNQHLASSVAAECCKHHRETSDEEHHVAGDAQSERIPQGEVEGEGAVRH